MQLQFIGCGDALGSGGRANTCFHVTGTAVNFLIDCGASSLPALKRQGDIDRRRLRRRHNFTARDVQKTSLATTCPTPKWGNVAVEYPSGA
jgi:hypothetical protein